MPSTVWAGCFALIVAAVVAVLVGGVAFAVGPGIEFDYSFCSQLLTNKNVCAILKA
jgi:hypothetical protein